MEASVETASAGPCAKVLNGFVGMCLGIILFPASLILLGWNENRFVCEDRRISFARIDAKPAECNAPPGQGQFMFFSCPIDQTTLATISLRSFNPAVNSDTPLFTNKVLAARQDTEWFTCQESCSTSKQKDSLGRNVDVTTCSYRGGWSNTRMQTFRTEAAFVALRQKYCPGVRPDVSSYAADPLFPLGSVAAVAPGLKAGAFEIFQNPSASSLKGQLAGRVSTPMQVADPKYSKVGVGGSQQYLRLFKNNLGEDCSGADLGARFHFGCQRVSYTVALPTAITHVSAITRSAGQGRTEPQTIKGSWGCTAAPWQEFNFGGQQTLEQMIVNLQAGNKATTWILRIVGAVCAWLSIYCCLQPIAAAADVMGDCINMCPCGGYIEDMLEGVVTTILCIMSCSVGCSCAIFVIAVVWVAMRPMIGIPMMLVSLCLCGLAVLARSQTTGQKKGRRGSQARDIEAASAYEMPQVAVPMATPMLVQPGPQMMQVQCPAGCYPGSPIQVTAPDGRQLQVVVPEGVYPGTMFQVQV